MIFYKVNISLTWLWIPILILCQLMLALGVILFSSALNVFYRDIRFIVPLVIQLWFYATPVIYPTSVVPISLKPLYALNPMVGIIDSYRQVLLFGENPSSTLQLT